MYINVVPTYLMCMYIQSCMIVLHVGVMSSLGERDLCALVYTYRYMYMYVYVCIYTMVEVENITVAFR